MEDDSEGILSLFRSLLSYPNYFEFIKDVEFISRNSNSLYDDQTHNLFNSISLIDLLFSFFMEARLFIIHKYCSFLIIQHNLSKANLEVGLRISQNCLVTMLDKAELYEENKEDMFPDYKYTVNGKHFNKYPQAETEYIERCRKLFAYEIKDINRFNEKGN